MSPHSHKFRFECNISNNHKHRLSGYTENMLGVSGLHIHHFYGVSSYNGHTHYYAGISGLPVRTANGHVHKIEGILEFNDLHEHKFCGMTFEDVGYITKKIPREAYL